APDVPWEGEAPPRGASRGAVAARLHGEPSARGVDHGRDRDAQRLSHVFDGQPEGSGHGRLIITDPCNGVRPPLPSQVREREKALFSRRFRADDWVRMSANTIRT